MRGLCLPRHHVPSYCRQLATHILRRLLRWRGWSRVAWIFGVVAPNALARSGPGHGKNLALF